MKNSKFLAIIIVLIILIGCFGLFYGLTRPSKEEVDAARSKVIVVPADILSDSIINQLDNFKQNGTLPINIGAQEKGRDNPFASF